MRRPFNKDTDVPICLLHVSTTGIGRILSKGGITPDTTRVRQYACACDPQKGLPKPATSESHAFTVDAREVTCPDCQQSEEFRKAFLHQTGKPFVSEMAAATEVVPLPADTLHSETIAPPTVPTPATTE